MPKECTMTELEERVAAIDERLAAIHNAHRSRRFPDQVRDEWNRLNAEREELAGIADETTTRRRRLESIVNSANPGAVERVGAAGQAPSQGEPEPVVRPGDPAPFVRLSDRRPAAVAAGQSFADHPVVAAYREATRRQEEAVVGQHGSLGTLLNSMSTSSGSAVVPTLWASRIIDRARNIAAVLRAGAQVVPMDAKTVQIGRLTTDPTAAFRAEGSTVTASDPVFDNVTLDSKTMSALLVGSMEWFMDSPNVGDIVENAIAQAVALRLDQQALFGGVIAGGETGATGFNTTFPVPPNPQGVLANLLANAASSVLGSGANGTAQTALTYWNEVITTIFTPQTFNETPNAALWNAKLAQQYASGYDSTGQPLAVPAGIVDLQRIVTNQIPSFTQGTMTTRATDLFVGDWSQLLIGQRLQFVVQTLTERYAELGQIGIIAHWRGDVGVARPRAFAVYRYLQGAA
jgi:HK97 family phage major capsid protein